ncbi:anti-sigma factor family protein [Streptomyces sp. NPDC001315]|uniref:anti-sigma factor family protein n=1 Tax=Streptomyces sp. NPDC001315 TaxID=3364562 RepID=UPI00368DE59D
MSNDVTCEKLREIGAELALGVLPGRERAEAVAHLDRCAACREYIEHMTLVGDGLIGLLPDREPPLGFETRVARRLVRDAALHEGGAQSTASGPGRKAFRGRARRARLRVASAVAAFGLTFGFVGWAVGNAIENLTASSSPAVEAGSRLMEGDLTSASGPRPPAGEIYAHPGDPGKPGWIYMSVDLAAAGTPYSGKVVCQLERSNGTSIRVGTFSLREGRAEWGAAAPVDPEALSGARLTSSDGTVLATGHFDTDRSA